MVGAGIGGLAAARALRAVGVDVTVVERAPALQAVGAGIVLAANAAAVLDALGIDLAPAGLRLRRLSVTDGAGRPIQDVVLASGEGGRAFALDRRGLHDRLREAAADVPIRLGTTVEGLRPEGGTVLARLSDGSEARWDLVVGADGIGSRVRALLYGAEDPPRAYSGYTCWRLLCANPGVEDPIEMWGRGRRVGLVPLPGGRLYVFLVADAPARAPSPPWPDVLAAFAAFGGPAPRALEAARAAASPFHHDLEDLSRPVWGRGRVWLLGDAAHAMLPNLGQGAAMAIEDAAALALAFREAPTVDAAFDRYLALRRDRVAAVWRRSRLMGRVAQWTNPAACWLRDGLFRLTPARVSSGQLESLLAPGFGLARRLAAA